MSPINTEELKARARVMKALASPVRLKIVDALSRGERCMYELQPVFPMNKSTLSRHIAELKNVGIEAQIEKVEKITEIMAFGVMTTRVNDG